MLREYRVEWLRNDVPAGLSVAAVALPVAIVYAQLAGFRRSSACIRRSCIRLAIAGVLPEVRRMLERRGALERLGKEALSLTLRAAVEAHQSRATSLDRVVPVH